MKKERIIVFIIIGFFIICFFVSSLAGLFLLSNPDPCNCLKPNIFTVVNNSFLGLLGLNASKNCNDVVLIDTKLGELTNKIETAIQSNQTIDFVLPACLDTEEITKLEKINDPKVCADYCGAGLAQCTFLIFTYKNTNVKKCVNVSFNSNFFDEACPKKTGYELQDLGKLILQGAYILEQSTLDNKPLLCAYKKS